MEQTDCAYLAGLIDADGNIGIDKFGGHRVWTVKMHLTNRDVGTLEELQEMWGGSIISRKRFANWQRCYDLRWHGAKSVRNVLDCIIPYLKIKRAQAKLALVFCETVNPPEHRTRELSPEALALREAIAEEFTHLNRRGE